MGGEEGARGRARRRGAPAQQLQRSDFVVRQLQGNLLHTLIAPSLPELFPDNRSVFCCLARRVTLEVAQTLYNNGTPFAWVHNKQVTCSWLCGFATSEVVNLAGAPDNEAGENSSASK